MNMDLATGYSAGILLHRIALSVPRRPAVSVGSEELSYAQLASRALAWLDLFEQSDPGTQSVPCSLHSPLDQIASIWGALLSRFPVRVPGDLSLVPPSPPYPAPRRMLAPQPGDAPALLLEHSHCGVLWDQKALALAWAIFSPPPGSIGVIHGRLSGPSTWTTAFGVLIGRGRALVEPFLPAPGWLEALARGGVTDVHLAPGEATKLAGLGEGSSPGVKRVFVWSPAAVTLDLLRSLNARFPSASISRILQSPAGPVTFATLAELSGRGADWCGRPVLGAQLTIEHGSGGAVLAARSVCAGKVLLPGAPWPIQEQVLRATRWPVRINSNSEIFLEKENAYA